MNNKGLSDNEYGSILFLYGLGLVTLALYFTQHGLWLPLLLVIVVSVFVAAHASLRDGLHKTDPKIFYITVSYFLGWAVMALLAVSLPKEVVISVTVPTFVAAMLLPFVLGIAPGLSLRGISLIHYK